MIRNFRTNKSSFNLQFNYRVSNVIIPIAMHLMMNILILQ